MSFSIVQYAKQNGLNNIVVVDTDTNQPMTITEARYKLSEGHKVTVKWPHHCPYSDSYSVREHHYYIKDFDTLVNQGVLEVHCNSTVARLLEA